MKYAGYFLLILISLAGCLGSLKSGFISDDFILLERSYEFDPVALFTENWLGESKVGGFYRPIVELFWELDYLFYGNDPRGFHLTNILLHLGVVLLMVRLIDRIERKFNIAFLAGLVFSLHPVHSEAIFWISGRTDLIASFFYLLTLVLFLQQDALNSGKKRYQILALLSAGLCFFSKEISFTLPLMLLFIDFADRHSSSEALSIPRKIWPFFIVLGLVLCIRWYALGQFIGGYGSEVHLRIGKHCAIYFFDYFSWLITPISFSFGSGSFPWFLMLFCCTLLFSLTLARKHLSFGIVWFVIAYLPIATVCRPEYLYLPSIGFAWMIGRLLFRIVEFDRSVFRKTLMAVCSTGLLISYAIQLNYQVNHWNYTGWQGVVIQEIVTSHYPVLPHNARIIFINPPVNNQILMGVIKNGAGSAVRTWYQDKSLEAVVLANKKAVRDFNPDRDIVFYFTEDRVYDITATMKEPRSSTPVSEWIKKPLHFTVSPEPREIPGKNTNLAGLEIFSLLSNSYWIKQSDPVCKMTVEFDTGEQQTYILRAGQDTSEWAIDREDVKTMVLHERAEIAYSYFNDYTEGAPAPGHVYTTSIFFDQRSIVSNIRFESLLSGSGPYGEIPQMEIRAIHGIESGK